MKNLEKNPTTYDEYSNLYDGERVYRFAYGSVDEAYAIRENGEDYDDFVAEVEYQLRRRHGRRITIDVIEDVTGTFED